MWSGWRRREKTRRDLKRILPDLKRVPMPDLKRVPMPDVSRLHLGDLKGQLRGLRAPEIDWGGGRMGSRAAALWPALFAAAGTGAAVWWWNQWARGRAEAEAAQAHEAGLAPVHPPSDADRAGGREGAASPETIMSHAPLEAAADGDGPAGRGAAGVETLAPHVRAALDESLAVQAQGAAPSPSKPAAR